MVIESWAMHAMPCGGQTSEQFGAWLEENPLVEGDEIAVRETQAGMWTYRLRHVTSPDHGGQHRIVVDQEGSFYRSGNSCFHPKGQTRLVTATDAVREAARSNRAFQCNDVPD